MCRLNRRLNTFSRVLLFLSLAGLSTCFRKISVDPSKIQCSVPDDCPSGYQCTSAGKCCRDANCKQEVPDGGQPQDGPTSTGGASGADGAREATDGTGQDSPNTSPTGTGGTGGSATTSGGVSGGGTGSSRPGSGGIGPGGGGGDTSGTRLGGAGAAGTTQQTGGGGTGGVSGSGGTGGSRPGSGGSGPTAGSGGAGGPQSGGAGTGGTTQQAGGGGTGIVGGSGGLTSAGGSTGTGECAQGQKKCSGNTLLSCDGAGRWPTTGTTCPYVCQDNACTGVCSPSTHTCSGNALLTCDAKGTWPPTGTTCPYVCRGNACTGQCTPDKFQCSGQTPQFCDADGNWQNKTVCPSGYACNEAKQGCACSLTQCADGRCIDTTADPMNCGTCGHACPGQCSSGSCKCTTQSPSNLVLDGGFDGDAAAWVQQSYTQYSVTRAPLDSANCLTSGSLLCKYTGVSANDTANAFGACSPIASNTAYNLGAWVYLPSAGGNAASAEIGMGWWGDASCTSGNELRNASGSIDGPYQFANNTLHDTWQFLHIENIVPPAGAKAAKFFLAVTAGTAGGTGQAYFDSLYFTPAPGRF